MNTLTALKRSTLGLDLYLWLTYRTFALRTPLRLTWPHLYRQFGAHPAKASDNNTGIAGEIRVAIDLCNATYSQSRFKGLGSARRTPS